MMLTARQRELIDRGWYAELFARALQYCGDASLAMEAADLALQEQPEPPVSDETINLLGEGAGAFTQPGDFAPEPKPPAVRDRRRAGRHKGRGRKHLSSRKLPRGLRLRRSLKKLSQKGDAAFATDLRQPDGDASFSSEESHSQVGIIADGIDLPDKIRIAHAFAPLKAVLVGVPDNDVLPLWYPTPKGQLGNEVGGPETAGMTKRQWDAAKLDRCIRQLDGFAELLQREGVEAYRAPLTPLNIGEADPVGLGASWAREEFTVIGNNLIVNQPRAPHRHKELIALGPFLAAVKQKMPDVRVLAPPTPQTWERNTDWEGDQRCFLEGGDIFVVSDRDVLVTLSYLATSGAGFRWLAEQLEEDGWRTWPAYLKRDRNDFEHGDYVFFPIRPGLCLAYLPAFVDGCLPEPCLDWTVVPLTLQEANENFQANGFVLRENLIVLPQGKNGRIVRALEKKGVDVLEAACEDVYYWQGAWRCATTELWRE